MVSLRKNTAHNRLNNTRLTEMAFQEMLFRPHAYLSNRENWQSPGAMIIGGPLPPNHIILMMDKPGNRRIIAILYKIEKAKFCRLRPGPGGKGQ